MEGSSSNRAEAERWLGIADKLLMARDLVGSKKFALRAQESDPLLDGVDQILAVADILLAAEKRINNHMDWYAILQLDRRSNDLELMKRQYRRLALLLHPDKNKSLFADNAFKLVADAWTVLSDPSKKTLYDNELNLFLKFDPIALNDEPPPPPLPQSQSQQQQQSTVRRSTREKKRKTTTTTTTTEGQKRHARNETQNPSRLSSFWTTCPYCYNLYEYPRVYEDCCLRCQNCKRAFHAAVVPSPPPVVPGKEAYYCCWAFFPLGFSMPNSGSRKNTSFPNWMPFSPMFPPSQPGEMRNPSESKTSSGGKDVGLVDISDESWDSHVEMRSRMKGKAVNAKKKNPKSSPVVKAKKGIESHLQDEFVIRGGERTLVPNFVKPQKKKTVAKKQKEQPGKGANNKTLEERPTEELKKVDLNVEVKNEVEEHAPAVGEGVEIGSGDEDVIEGIGFFEGLDDILVSLPILSVPEDQKVEGA